MPKSKRKNKKREQKAKRMRIEGQAKSKSLKIARKRAIDSFREFATQKIMDEIQKQINDEQE
jgi:hypothetical protein